MEHNKPITLTTKVGSNEVVRLRPAATKLVKQLQGETGMSASAIVSEIVYQALTVNGVKIRFDVDGDEVVQVF